VSWGNGKTRVIQEECRNKRIHLDKVRARGKRGGERGALANFTQKNSNAERNYLGGPLEGDAKKKDLGGLEELREGGGKRRLKQMGGSSNEVHNKIKGNTQRGHRDKRRGGMSILLERGPWGPESSNMGKMIGEGGIKQGVQRA